MVNGSLQTSKQDVSHVWKATIASTLELLEFQQLILTNAQQAQSVGQESKQILERHAQPISIVQQPLRLNSHVLMDTKTV